jgi:ATP-binding cassette subfamily B protein
MGIIFIVLSNYFRILAPQVTKYVLNTVEIALKKEMTPADKAIRTNYDPIVQSLFVDKLKAEGVTFKKRILYSGIILLALAIVSGFFYVPDAANHHRHEPAYRV